MSSTDQVTVESGEQVADTGQLEREKYYIASQEREG